MGIGQFIHICVNGKHLVHGLAHIRNEVVNIREVLELRVVLIIVDHAHYSRGNYGTFAVGPDRFGMVVLLDQKGYEFPDAVFLTVSPWGKYDIIVPIHFRHRILFPCHLH